MPDFLEAKLSRAGRDKGIGMIDRKAGDYLSALNGNNKGRKMERKTNRDIARRVRRGRRA